MISPKMVEALCRLKIFGGDLRIRDLFREGKPEHINYSVLEKSEKELKDKLKK